MNFFRSTGLNSTINYKCINCGECCKRLLISRQGVTKGLPLLTHEKNLFNKKDVSPSYGLGTSPENDTFKIIAYQMNKMICPHRKYGGCIIWAYRPTICRSYPLIPTISKNNEVVKTIDFTCTALHELRLDRTIDKVLLNSESIFVENENYLLISKITYTLLENLEIAWFFDLNEKKWINFSSML